MAKTFVIRPMDEADLPAAACLHQQAFKGFFLSAMGPAFLKGYYAAILSYDLSLALVMQQGDGQIVGFVVGFRNPEGFYAHLRSHRFRLLPSVLIALLRRPSLLRPVLRNARRVARPQGDMPDSRLAELASLATSIRGSGIGSALVSQFCRSMFKAGAARIVLTTDKDNNEIIQNFYARQGFILSDQERRGDRVLYVYSLKNPDYFD